MVPTKQLKAKIINCGEFSNRNNERTIRIKIVGFYKKIRAMDSEHEISKYTGYRA
jgi:hypothetical protein